MSIACRSGNHCLPADPILNQGFAFARCTRCGRDLLRAAGTWRAPPRGFRIVWKDTAADDGNDPDQLAFELKPPVRALVAPLPSLRRGPRARLGGAADLVASALRLGAWHFSAAARLWLKSALAPRRRVRLIAFSARWPTFSSHRPPEPVDF
jgi:hypothetical protein